MNGVAHRAVGQPWPESAIFLALDSRLPINGVTNVQIRIAELRRATKEDRLVTQRRSLGDEKAKVVDIECMCILMPVAEGVQIFDLDPVLVIGVGAGCHVAGAISPTILSRNFTALCSLGCIVAGTTGVRGTGIRSRRTKRRVFGDRRTIL